MIELRFPPQVPSGALNPTDHSTSSVHGVIPAGATCRAAELQEGFDKLQSVGVDPGDVHLALENDGVEKCQAFWDWLMKAAQTEFGAAVGTQQICSAGKFDRLSR